MGILPKRETKIRPESESTKLKLGSSSTTVKGERIQDPPPPPPREKKLNNLFEGMKTTKVGERIQDPPPPREKKLNNL